MGRLCETKVCVGVWGGGRARARERARARVGGIRKILVLLVLDLDEEDDAGGVIWVRWARGAGFGLLALGQQARDILPTSLLCKIASTRTTVSTIMESVSVVLSAAAVSFDSPPSSASSVSSRVICAESTCTASEREEGRGHTSSSRTTPCLRTSCRPISSTRQRRPVRRRRLPGAARACSTCVPGVRGGESEQYRENTGLVRVYRGDARR